jgi:UDP-3-O-[3-hydroxymyristoyl] glucosamine N-acyltransferase
VLIKKKKLPMRELVLRGFLPSFLKVWFYRRKGFRIGKNVYFGLGSVIIGKLVDIKDNAKIGFLTILKSNRIDIGRHVHIGSFVYIDTEKLEIGEDSEIREYVYVAGLKTPDSMLKLGKRCGIFQYCFLNSHMEILN